ncbi:MAG TPA: hypothetical protein VFX70_03090, partial [Mycobacteriales bacterium]|nr:hypothetical protein [Mycobacteriales bacterium]
MLLPDPDQHDDSGTGDAPVGPVGLAELPRPRSGRCGRAPGPVRPAAVAGLVVPASLVELPAMPVRWLLVDADQHDDNATATPVTARPAWPNSRRLRPRSGRCGRAPRPGGRPPWSAWPNSRRPGRLVAGRRRPVRRQRDSDAGDSS